MPRTADDLLRDGVVLEGLRQAWLDSNPGTSGGHEEGGFIVEGLTGALQVVRWLHGTQARIRVPSHEDCQIEGQRIVASYHTHPNTGGDYQQEPSAQDQRAVRSDPHLKAEGYIGEFIISHRLIYRVSSEGHVSEEGLTGMLLSITN